MKTIPRPRTGLSVVEVLTSIVVAMIGVFGIMVMIPFAIQQSQSGLDRDAATVLARNAEARLETQGYRNPENWVSAPLTPVDPTVPQVFSIDPLAILSNGSFATTAFPINAANGAANPLFPTTYLIPPANLRDFSGADMSLAGARRMFQGADELVFGEAVDELEGPTPYFDVDSNATPNFVRRQSRGSLSWSVIMAPYKPDPTTIAGAVWNYRAYTLVYKDRSLDVGDPEVTQMFTTPVDPASTPPGPATPVGTVYLNATQTLPIYGSDRYRISKGDWMMLINRRKNTTETDGVAEPGFEFQIGFYRLVNYSIDESNPAAPILESVTLDGPDFDFGDLSDPSWDPRGTHLVHLRDVIAVYERDLVREEASNWN